MLPMLTMVGVCSLDNTQSISVPSYIIIAEIENGISSALRLPYFWTFRGERIPPNVFQKKYSFIVLIGTFT